MIGFDHVTVRYRHAREDAVRDVTLGCARGSITAVVGPNGSGKTSLVRALLRQQPLRTGVIRVDGIPLGQLDRRDVARRVAVVTQREEPFFALPIRQYVGLGRFPHQRSARHARNARAADAAVVERAIALAGAAELSDRTTTELSGGEWQRVRIARALAQGGQGLVLDEPTTFLDVAHEMSVFELLAALARDGMAVFVVSHQLNLVARFAHTMVLLHRGTVVAAGPPDDVMRAEILERVYGWPLRVLHDATVGAPALIPLRAPVRT